MKIIGKCLPLEEFQEYVQKKDFGSLPPTFIVLHHTWKPRKEEWQGEKTLFGIKRYYEGKEWSAGPHLFIADDGIWLFTDMFGVGIHAGEGNGTLKTGYSIGIEVVGDYDKEKWSGKTKTNALGAILILQERLKISNEKIKFHRDYSTKTCPGRAIIKDWVFEELKNFNKNETMKIPSKFKDELEKTQDILKGVKEYEKEVKHKFKDEMRPEDLMVVKELMSGTRNLYEDAKNKPPQIIEKPIEVIKEVIVEEFVYQDSQETLKKLEDKKQEVIDLQEALKNHSGIHKILVDVKSGLQKLWEMIK